MQTINYRGWYTNIDYATLSNDEELHNGMKLAQNLYNFGWTENSIAGIIGNVEGESGLNPGCIESPKPWTDLPDNETILISYYTLGIGFTQWTPGRDKIVQFAEDTGRIWYDGMTQVFRLKWEHDNHEQMANWDWFVASEDDPADLAEYFLRQYERPSPEQIEQSLENRRRAATRWYGIIHDHLANPKLLMYTQYNRKRKELKRRCLRV